MRTNFTSKLVAQLVLFLLPFLGMAQVASSGDYRSSVVTGNWSAPASWEVRDGSGNWTVASAAPSSSNNVYVQSGHIITIDVLAACKDLHFCTNEITATPLFVDPGKLVLDANYLDVSGKMRAFTNVNGPITGATDGAFYTQVSAITNFSSTAATTTTGAIRIVGGTRTVFAATEWGASGFSNCALEFNLTPGSIASVDNAIKFKSMVISNGSTVNAGNNSNARMAVDDGSNTGFLTIKSGGKLISLRSGGNVISASATTRCGTVTIEAGAILELTGSGPTIDCTSFVNNGTVIYSRAGTQTLLKPGTDILSTTALNSYNTLILAVSNTKTPFASITVSNLLQFTGTATIGATAALTLTMLNGSTVDRSSTSGTQIPSTAGAVFYGTDPAHFVNVTIGASNSNSNELASAPTPGKIGTLTINPGVIYNIGGSRTVNNIVNNGQIVMTPNTSMTTTVTGVISGTGVYSTKLSTTAPISYAASFAFTGPGPVGTLNMKNVTDSNRLRNFTLNSAGGLILGAPVFVDTAITLTAGVLTNGANLTLSGVCKLTRTAGSLASAPAFAGVHNISYNDVLPTTTGFELPTSATALGNLSISNNAGVTLNAPATVNGVLALSSGVLTTSATKILTLATTATYTGGSNSNHVSGPMVMNTSAAVPVTFPVGKGGSYRPVTLTPTGASSYKAEYFNTGYVNTASLLAPLTAVSNTEYWDVSKNSGADATVSLSLNGAALSGASAADAVVVSHFSFGNWVAEGGTLITPGNATTGTATSKLITTFSPFTLGYGNDPILLPLKLLSFNAALKNGAATLNWSTTNETNLSNYIVEQSADGRVFGSIGSVNAMNSPGNHAYNFTSPSPLTSNTYFRIKMQDLDGKVSYSSIVLLQAGKEAIIGIYPNPVGSNLNITGLKTNATLRVINAKGQTMMQQKTGANSISIDVADYLPGYYILEVSSDGVKTINKTFIKK